MTVLAEDTYTVPEAATARSTTLPLILGTTFLRHFSCPPLEYHETEVPSVRIREPSSAILLMPPDTSDAMTSNAGFEVGPEALLTFVREGLKPSIRHPFWAMTLEDVRRINNAAVINEVIPIPQLSTVLKESSKGRPYFQGV